MPLISMARFVQLPEPYHGMTNHLGGFNKEQKTGHIVFHAGSLADYLLTVVVEY